MQADNFTGMQAELMARGWHSSSHATAAGWRRTRTCSSSDQPTQTLGNKEVHACATWLFSSPLTMDFTVFFGQPSRSVRRGPRDLRRAVARCCVVILVFIAAIFLAINQISSWFRSPAAFDMDMQMRSFLEHKKQPDRPLAKVLNETKPKP